MRRIALLILLFLPQVSGSAQMQSQKYKPIASDGQYLMGPGAENQGYFGFGASLSVEQQGMIIETVESGGPANRAGLQAGDKLTRVDGQQSFRIPERRWIGNRFVRPGESVQLSFSRDGAEQTVTLVAEPYVRFHPEVLKGPPSVNEFIWNGGVTVTAELDKVPDGAEDWTHLTTTFGQAGKHLCGGNSSNLP